MVLSVPKIFGPAYARLAGFGDYESGAIWMARMIISTFRMKLCMGKQM